MEDRSKIAVSLFNKNANLYEEKYMDISLYHKSLDLFCDTLNNKNAKLLEVACGPGNITSYLIRNEPDFKILGTDLAPNMIELAKVNNPTANFQLLDCRTISSLGAKFDGIISGFCLPYLSKEEAIKFIFDSATQLNEKGVLYISTMEDYNSKSNYVKGSTGEELFMNYHEASYLTNALEINNFEIISIDRIEYETIPNEKTVDLIIIARKK
ncbi:MULTISPECIES: class I SAM-dependent methyltransferase [Flavobacterium]|uniref:Class I SAM-dependent methyltransferase n=1 Tax=Flavobacterium jumunjinense TaxID=998845 RepID=A0ABV5GRZ9_9FLAO|nr:MULTISPECIES: class I SAM-dependent methyltransferase [Flavobacterium]